MFTVDLNDDITRVIVSSEDNNTRLQDVLDFYIAPALRGLGYSFKELEFIADNVIDDDFSEIDEFEKKADSMYDKIIKNSDMCEECGRYVHCKALKICSFCGSVKYKSHFTNNTICDECLDEAEFE